MNTIGIAIIEKSPLASVALEDILTRANFDVVINTESIHYFLDSAREKSISIPEICLLDTTATVSSVNSIRKCYPKIKIVVYDPIGFRGKRSILPSKKIDAYIPKSLKIEQWITILQNIVNCPDYSTA